MFTGIIEHLGKIEEISRGEKGGRLHVSFAKKSSLANELKIGASIAVNGCCLTAVEIARDSFAADLSKETFERTTFASARNGQIVNLELPLAAGARLGGHFVQGHVDGTGPVACATQEGENCWLGVRIPSELQKYVAEKGSLAVDGISLTVARWAAASGIAEFAIIPHTFAHTNLQKITAADSVNLECDILAKYVEGLLASKTAAPQRLTVDALIAQGF